jgi:hypothetical protein
MMGRFRRFIDDMAIKEIPLHGRKYTWTSKCTGDSPTLVKLDRFFCSVQFPDCLLNSAAYDYHCPLFLGLKDNIQGKRRFQFESFWAKFESFQDVVQQAWTLVQCKPCPWKLSLKFKVVAKGLQSWSDKKVGHFKTQLEMAREIIHQLEIARTMGSCPLFKSGFVNV